MSKGINITSENFDSEVAASPIPVLIDFWASWCVPCQTIGPLIDQLAGEYEGRLKVCKVNVDEQGDLAGRHGVASIPTLVVYKDGAVVQRLVGAAPKQQIESLFRDLL